MASAWPSASRAWLPPSSAAASSSASASFGFSTFSGFGSGFSSAFSCGAGGGGGTASAFGGFGGSFSVTAFGFGSSGLRRERRIVLGIDHAGLDLGELATARRCRSGTSSIIGASSARPVGNATTAHSRIARCNAMEMTVLLRTMSPLTAASLRDRRRARSGESPPR